MNIVSVCIGALKELPVLETTIVLILTFITVFRRELSSNRSYRKRRKGYLPTKLPRPDWNTVKGLQDKLMTRLQGDVLSSSSTGRQNNRGSLDFNQDVMLIMLSYLSNAEISRLSCVSPRLAETLSADFFGSNSGYSDMGKSGGNLVYGVFLISEGWKLFLFEFEYGWLDWVLAGCNTPEMCVLGIDGAIYDVTSFVSEHPGSPETMLDFAGGDATGVFNEIGHSSFAQSIKDAYLMARPVNAPLPCLTDSPAPSSSLVASVSSLLESSENIRRPPITLLQRRMHIERRVVRRIADSEFRAVNVMCESRINRAPGREMDCHDSLQDEEGGVSTHAGQARVFYDPLAQDWWVWWSCCGCGRTIHRDHIDEILAGM